MSLNSDFQELVKLDTPMANKARYHLQYISINDLALPSFKDESYSVIGNNFLQNNIRISYKLM